jgi:hypothetical protein
MSVELQSLEVTYQLIQEGYRHGLRAWQTRTRWRLWNYRASVIVMIALFLLGMVFLAWSPSLEIKYFCLFALGMPAVWFLCLWIGPRAQARLQYRRMPSAQVPTTMTVSDSGIHVRSQHYDSHVNRSTYIGWSEGKSVFVLFPQPRLYVPIPKRAFSSEQLERFREILRRNVGKK